MKFLLTALDSKTIAHFLEGLKSFAIIRIKRKWLAGDNNYFSLIFRTWVILSFVQIIGQMLIKSL